MSGINRIVKQIKDGNGTERIEAFKNTEDLVQQNGELLKKHIADANSRLEKSKGFLLITVDTFDGNQAEGTTMVSTNGKMAYHLFQAIGEAKMRLLTAMAKGIKLSGDLNDNNRDL